VRETTVAIATFLVNTSPVMLAVLSPLMIKERTTSREGVSIVVAIFGILLVANAGNGFGSFGLGEVSALLAAFLVSVYSVIGRSLRTRGLNTACYTAYAYSFGTIVALLVVTGAGAAVYRPYNIQNILAILALGLFPTAIGHTLYNYSLGSVKTVTANIVPLLEPIIASGLAVPLFNEIPNLVEVCGYALILVAVIIVVSGVRPNQALFV
jgi:drug/metabolite transporter (DMT)-like permease